MRVKIKKRSSTILKFLKGIFLTDINSGFNLALISHGGILLGLWVKVHSDMCLPHKCPWESQMPLSRLIPQELSVLYFEAGSLIGLELTDLARLAIHRAIDFLPSLSPQHQDFKHTPPSWLFHLGSGDRTSSMKTVC